MADTDMMDAPVARQKILSLQEAKIAAPGALDGEAADCDPQASAGPS
jgi:hypothetical protein